MADFQPLVVSKDGFADRMASSPVELVQFEYEGWGVQPQPEKRTIKATAKNDTASN